MQVRIDHITLAGPDLEPMRQAFAARGLEPEYGGPHSNGITHMCWLGFDDGSYLELVSTLTPGRGVPLWPDHIPNPRGCAAWTIGSMDLRADVDFFRAGGVEMHEPLEVRRTKPDGRIGAWDLACPAGVHPGGTLPFLIQDHTPRSVRVTPSPSVAMDAHAPTGGALTGLSHVALAVNDLDRVEATFRRLFGWPKAIAWESGGIRVRRFRGTPVLLCAPRGVGSCVRRHLEEFGETPWAFFFGSRKLEQSRVRYGLEKALDFAGLEVCWLDLPVRVARVGIAAAEIS
jgi:hypothetical protein